MAININDCLYGFRVKRKTEIKELDATLYDMEYEGCGARLLFLDREDTNKTFSVSFKTIPEDSTGVFHIIEHSVLCGSRKYPVKEPFVELLKGSLQTFLNAMTFPDKTMYPVSTRNDRDFLNLISVYMDAVLHPAILENPNIFRQEGWHYELDEKSGELSRSGVVLNEMRGAYSSPEEVEMFHMTDMLYDGTCYRFESGGMPSDIAGLSYEDFISAHKKYYHPSNSEMFLDGSVNLFEVLPLLDSFLKEYKPLGVSFEIADRALISPRTRSIEYEISENEDTENKTRLAMGFMSSRFDEQKKNIAIEILMSALAFTNESPLKKAILDSGLCEEMDVAPYDSVKENFLNFEFRNVLDGECDKLTQLFFSTVKRLVSEGIDKELLRSSLNNLEFRLREKDYGTYPRGVVFAMSVIALTLYGGDAAEALCSEKYFDELRTELEGDYFEHLLRELILDNTQRATLIMTPSKALGRERVEKERSELQKICASLSNEQKEEILRMNKELSRWQSEKDGEEQMKTLPMLTLSDISDKAEYIPCEEKEVSGVTAIVQKIPAGGIIYTEYYFDISDLLPDELFDLRLLITLMTNVKTEHHSVIELQNLIKRELGAFEIRMTTVKKDGETKIYAVLSASALESKREELMSTIKEVLYASVYSDREVLKNLVRQMKMEGEDYFTSSGHSAGFRRALAGAAVDAAVDEYYSGYEAYTKIKALEKNISEMADEALCGVSALAERIFTKERLLLSVTGESDEGLLSGLAEIIKSGDKYDPVCKIKPFGKRNEGIAIPAQVAFAQIATNLSELSEKYSPSMSVAKSILTYGHLWNKVRVQGGAYGVGLLIRNTGNLAFYSYRDPSPKRSIAAYSESGAVLRAFAESGEDITKFIIGAIGDADPLTTPRLKGVLAATRYLRGITYDDLCESRKKILSTDSEELCRIADILCRVPDVASLCVVGGRDKLSELEAELDVILEI